MRILVINPNTTQSMTATIADAATRIAGRDTDILAVTSSMGPVSIEGYYDEVSPCPACCWNWQKRRRLEPTRRSSPVSTIPARCRSALADIPVIGICEAAVSATAFIAQKFTIVTTMERSRLPLEHLVHRYGMSARCNVRAPIFRFCRWKIPPRTLVKGCARKSRWP
ncbi:aspartate/glutamate racemase family protein [Agrobacterium sp. T29]|uniref:aspartate/glutamate racemase family protein n=1 Tax=Agrobacterium sp. T29 TaxID=2580515 RepID=UPI00210FD25A|nr:aspartate/glutamate racemase family protein [Agrobacterium sp. T29]